MVGNSLAGLQDHLKLAGEYALEGLYNISIIFFDGAICSDQQMKYRILRSLLVSDTPSLSNIAHSLGWSSGHEKSPQDGTWGRGNTRSCTTARGAKAGGSSRTNTVPRASTTGKKGTGSGKSTKGDSALSSG